MTVSRTSKLAGLVVMGSLALTACGSGNNTASTTPDSTASTGAATAAGCASGSLNAQGSTFQLNAELQWSKDFAAKCAGAQVAYQGTGSGAGKTAFGNATADFGGTDSLLKAPEQAAADMRCGAGNKGVVTPIIAGAVVLTYNLPGVDKLVLSPTNVAKIFEGKITKWDDAALKADNTGTTLPSIPIVTVHRNDKSGTTKIFSSWLDANAKADWTLGADETLTWPGGQSAKGSDGVTTAVSQAKGGLTYTELSFAKQRKLATASVKNASGAAVEPTAAGVSSALATATVGTEGGLTVKPDYATKAADAYPLSAPTYVLTCDKGNKNAALLKAYLSYVLGDGKAVLDGLGYAPLPDAVATKATAAVDALS